MLTLSVYLSNKDAEKIEVLRKRGTNLSRYFRDAGLQRFERERRTFDQTDKAVSNAVESVVKGIDSEELERVAALREAHDKAIEKATQNAAWHWARIAAYAISRWTTAPDSNQDNGRGKAETGIKTLWGSVYHVAEIYDWLERRAVPDEVEEYMFYAFGLGQDIGPCGDLEPERGMFDEDDHKSFMLEIYGVPRPTDEMRAAGREAFLQTLARLLKSPKVATGPELTAEMIALVEKGKEQGAVTYDDILDVFPEAEDELDKVDALYQILMRQGVSVIADSASQDEGGP